MSSNTWVCVATGPSLTDADVAHCREKGWHLATCNRGYEYVPDAEVFVANDFKFWKYYGGKALTALRPECRKWCGCHQTVAPKDVPMWRSMPHRGFVTEHGHVGCGGPSGYMLVQVVYWEAIDLYGRAPDRIILLGYDNQHGRRGERHCHANYPAQRKPDGKWEHFSNANNPKRWIRAFDCLAKDAPVPIINATRNTALTQFTRAPLESL